MGTLFKQSERNSFKVSKSDAENFLKEAIDLAKKHKVEVSDVIEIFKILELKRKNDLYHWNGDTFDEQMAGIGELLKEANGILRKIAEEE